MLGFGFVEDRRSHARRPEERRRPEAESGLGSMLHETLTRRFTQSGLLPYGGSSRHGFRVQLIHRAPGFGAPLHAAQLG